MPRSAGVTLGVALGLVISVLLTACEREIADAAQPAGHDAQLGSAAAIDLANDLAMLVGGRSSSPAELDQLASRQFSRDAYATYIGELLATPEAAQLAERVLRLDLGGMRAIKTMGVLQHVEVQGEKIYYVHKPCERGDAVQVKPWWDLSRSVLVCRDSYRPEVFGDDTGALCTGHFGSPLMPASPCGCGPNLIRCGDSKTIEQLQSAVASEHKGTISYIVANDLPVQIIFSANESFRNGLAEFVYQRGRIETREITSLEEVPAWSSWPEKGKWAPRHESRKGQHAGITTNNYFTQSADSVRLKMVDLFNPLWCDIVQSSGVSTDSLLDLTFHAETVNFRSQTNPNDLASREGCSSCHARMDYGAQFYSGMQWSHVATHYDPRRQLDTPGPMYLLDIKDPRGTVKKRNPASFIQLALAQPEFPACIAQDFATHVFGKVGNRNSELIGELEQLVRKQSSYRVLFRRILEFYTDKRFAEMSAAGADPTRVTTGGGVTGGVVAMVDEHCSSCHDADDPRPPGLIAKHGAGWCKAMGARCPDIALEMLVPLANDRMPQNEPMGYVERVAMIKELAAYVWPDPKQRDTSLRFFTAQALGGKPVHRSEAIIESIRTLVPGAPPDATVPVTTLQTFGTSLAAKLAISAARVCIKENDQATCIRRALSTNRILK